MPKPTTASTNDARLRRLRELAASCGEYTNHIYAHLLGDRRGEIPAFALLYERAGTRELLLNPTSDLLAAIAQDELEHDPTYSPTALVCLDSGEQRPARMPVFFMAAAMTLPSLVGDIIDCDLDGREGDLQRNPEREEELRRAVFLIYDASPVPAELFTAIADVIDLDLEDRRHDAKRDGDAEALLREIHDQLLFRAPARNYAAGAPTGN